MKDLKNTILEKLQINKNTSHKHHADTASIGDFAKWYCLGEMPDGKEGKVTPADVQGLIDNGWFDTFGDDKNSAKKAADFINKNWDETVTVVSQDLGNTWEISFEFDGTEYSADAISYFGDELDE